MKIEVNIEVYNNLIRELEATKKLLGEANAKLEEYRVTERNCYEALGYSLPCDTALPALIDQTVARLELLDGNETKEKQKIWDAYAQAALSGLLADPATIGSAEEVLGSVALYADAAMRERKDACLE